MDHLYPVLQKSDGLFDECCGQLTENVTSTPYVHPIDSEVIIRNIFERTMTRSQHLLILAESHELCVKMANTCAQLNGANTQVCEINPNNSDQKQLLTAVKNITSNLLSQRCYIFMYVNNINDIHNIFHDNYNVYQLISTCKRLAVSLRAGFINFIHKPDNYCIEMMKAVASGVPKHLVSYMGYRPTLSLREAQLPDLNSSDFMTLQNMSYTMFERSLTTSFLASIANYNLTGSYQCNYPDKIPRIFVVGYNPQYVSLALQNGSMVRFLEVSTPKNDNDENSMIILPDLNNVPYKNKSRSSKTGRKYWIQSHSQQKLGQIDYTIFNMVNQIIYLGINPASHLFNLNLKKWKIIGVDPNLSPVTVDGIQQSCPSSILFNEEFNYSFKNLNKINRTSYIDFAKPFAIIDDVYPGDAPGLYQSMQVSKIKFYNDVVRKYPNVIIALKLNLKTNTTINQLQYLLPQPYGGELKEMRAIMSGDQNVPDFEYRAQDVDQYMNKFANIKTEEQLKFSVYMHSSLIINQNALNYNFKSHSLINCLYSLSNEINDKSSVLQWLEKMRKNNCIVLFSAPNGDRLKYKLKYSNRLTNVMRISDNKVYTKTSRRNKPWVDISYNFTEMRKIGYLSVTPEIIAGTMGSFYHGVGYVNHGDICDITDIYLPFEFCNKIFRYQTCGTSPMGNVKAFTHMVTDGMGVSKFIYYWKRAELVGNFLMLKGIPPDSYRLIGDGNATFTALRDIRISTFVGDVFINASDSAVSINLSGHLLSLAIAAHFIPNGIHIWIKQMLTMSRGVDFNILLQSEHDKMLFFDNIVRNGIALPWHSQNELILTLCILKGYVNFMLNGHFSESIIDDIIGGFRYIMRE